MPVIVKDNLSTNVDIPDVIVSPTQYRMGAYHGVGGSITPTTGALILTQSTVGSGVLTGFLFSSTGTKSRFTTGTTINSIIGQRAAATYTERDLNPWCQWRITLPTITNARMFVGLQSATTAPTSSADPLANIHGVGFWFDTGVHATNIAIMQNNGAVSSDKTTLANVGTMTTAIHTYALRADNTNSKFQYSYDGGAWGNIIPLFRQHHKH